ncbi:hypothetical protein DFJ58DRAFT_740016 [Suillus subalutaceus]|uniref:uncharacterized protein n=1 Tax=Suillus subalutaceus TaxID=48586 RepID=UPI001B872346|nr:uncharacterized protein DFJ58DRAFT_740016 [Suillus subalutaceus]KAG1814110.1 hypothetical protein DFJ58DRAFT_740016 [Suillus subalutaceus]
MPYALAQSHISRALQSHQAPVQGTLLDPRAVGHHAKHIDIMESGWRSYFPLFELCPSTDLLVKRTEAESCAMECSLSFANFREASQNLVLLISSYLTSPDRIAITASWQKHHDLIFGHPNVYSAFATYLIYDESLHMAFPKHSGDFDPSVFQVRVWQSILDQQHEEHMVKFDHMMVHMSSSTSVSKPLAAPAHPSASPSSAPSRKHPHPAQTSFWREAAADSRDKPTSSSFCITSLCWFCGELHCPKECPSVDNSWLVKDAQGAWKGPGNISVCFFFNGSKGCC